MLKLLKSKQNYFIIFLLSTYFVYGQSDFQFHLDFYAKVIQNNILDESKVIYADLGLSSISNEISEEIEKKKLSEVFSKYTDNSKYLSDKYTMNELNHFKLQCDVLIDFILAINPHNNGKGFMKFDDLSIVEEFINIKIKFISVDKFCVDILTISINDFTSYFAYNKSETRYSVYSKSTHPNLEITQGIPIKNIRQIKDNYGNINRNSKFNFEILCKKI